MNDDKKEEPAESAGEKEEGMSFLEHLEDFRWTVGRSLLSFLVGVFVVVFFMRDLSGFLQMPLIYAYGSAETAMENLVTYRPMGVFSVFLQVAFLGGLVASMPFTLYFLGCFVAPGLTERERKVLRPGCVAAFFLFVLGVAFAFFFVLPLTLSFAVRFNEFFGFSLLWAASEYYNLVVWFSLATGAFFQFPLLILILVYLEVVPVAKLKSMRRMVFVGLMVFLALVTPGGDFITLPTTTALMYALYEMAIWMGARIEAKKRDEEWNAWDDVDVE